MLFRSYNILHFASKEGMEIDGLGFSIIEQLYDRNLISGIIDIYNLKLEDVASLKKNGKKFAQNLIDAIENSKSNSLEKWLDYLGYEGPIIDEKEIIKKFKEEKSMKTKVMALKNFEGILDAERNVMPKEGDEWITSKERAEYLEIKNVVKIIKIIKEEEPKKEVKKQAERKKRKTIKK